MPRLSLLPGLALAAVLMLAGGACTSLPPSRPAPPVGAPPASAPAAPALSSRNNLAETLAVEQQWLLSFFKGTPVRIALLGNGSLAVEVPREFSFAPGSSRIKPPLAAVLDKVAESLRRRPAATLLLLAAPQDEPAQADLGLQRAAQVQKHLRDRGVAPSRLVKPATQGVAAVQLRIGQAQN